MSYQKSQQPTIIKQGRQSAEEEEWRCSRVRLIDCLVCTNSSSVKASASSQDEPYVNAVNMVAYKCQWCGEGHLTKECFNDLELVNFVRTYNRQHNNPYSNRYNPGQKNHPNFVWRSNQVSTSTLRQQTPPDFQEHSLKRRS